MERLIVQSGLRPYGELRFAGEYAKNAMALSKVLEQKMIPFSAAMPA